MKDQKLDALNGLLVETFNAILKVEERSLRLATREAVTVTEMHILDAVGKEGAHTVTELADISMVTVSTMTIAINRLEKKELVRRERDQLDRRVVRVFLTERGRTIAYAHQRFHRRMARAVAEHLREEELDVLLRSMDSLRGFFDGENEKYRFSEEFQGLPEEPASQE